MTDPKHPGVKMIFVIDEDRTVESEVPYMQSRQLRKVRGRRTGQEVWTGRRQGANGLWVQRDMIIDRDHSPPFKWHRVVDEASGEVLKDEAINMMTNELVDLRRRPRPVWLPTKVRYDRSGTSVEYELAPIEPVPRVARIHLTAQAAADLGAALVR